MTKADDFCDTENKSVIKDIALYIFVGFIYAVFINRPAWALTPTAVPTSQKQVIVVFKESPKTTSLSGLIQQSTYSLSPAYGIAATNAMVFSIAGQSVSDAITELKKNDNVLTAYPNFYLYPMMVPNDPAIIVTPVSGKPRDQWYLFNTKTAGEGKSAWDVTTGSPSIVVGVIDSGVDSSHPDLIDKITSLVECVGGPCHEVNSMTDDMKLPHGTHVSGLVAAATNNGVGIAGTGYNTKIMVIKVMDTNGKISIADVDNAIKWAADHGVRVINMSLGSLEDNIDASAMQEIKDAVKYAWDKNIVIVTSAGNCGANTAGNKACAIVDSNGNTIGYATNHKMYPAAAENVLSVASLTVDNTLAPYSEHNDPSDVKIGKWISVAAPGGFCTSSNDAYNCILSTFYSTTGKYGYIMGTSQAAPQVAGIAALILALNPSLTNAQVKNIIESSTNKSIAADATNNGMVDALAAVSAVTPAVVPSMTITLTVSPTGGATVTPSPTNTQSQITPSPSLAVTNTPAPIPVTPTPTITMTPVPTTYPTTPPKFPRTTPYPYPSPPYCPKI